MLTIASRPVPVDVRNSSAEAPRCLRDAKADPDRGLDQNGWGSFGGYRHMLLFPDMMSMAASPRQLLTRLCAGAGVATLVGIIGPVAPFIGGDSAVQLAEELQDAS